VKEVADEYGLAHEVHSVAFDEEPTITLMPAFLHPSGRGSITLRSADPLEYPVIRHELFGHRADLEGLMAGTRLARRIAQQPSLRKFIVEEVLPGSSINTDDELEAYTRASGFTGKHPAGTCRMGSDDDAVVDPQLRVRGVEGLRVVDASVMPVLTSGNTNAPTIMIAERASALVKADKATVDRAALGLTGRAAWPQANGDGHHNGASPDRDAAKAR
jgi:choline dehydrogenase